MDWLSPAAVEASPLDSWRENVAAIVVDAAGRVLLGLASGENAYWHFPQGGVGSKETLEQALRRELMEEVRLSPEHYRIITCYGGLRYRYRRNNEKCARWCGQEQTWFLVLCHAEQPPVDYSGTDEFCALTWVPWRKLDTELMAPVKRKVLSKVLAAFFPPHLDEGELMPYLLSRLTPRRYQWAGRELAACATDDRALFGGGKEEMRATLLRLGLRLRAAQERLAATTGRSLLVLLHGAEDSGRKQCLRRLAAPLNPLLLRVAEVEAFAPGIPWELLQLLPPAGNVTFVISHVGGALASAKDWEVREQWFASRGISVLKLYLHTAASSGVEGTLAATDSARSPWYIIPSERRWYRDYLVATLVAEALEA